MSVAPAARLNSVLLDVLELPPGTALADDTLLEDLPNLDSLKFLKLVQLLEAETGGILSAEAIMDIETVGDLRQAFDSSGA